MVHAVLELCIGWAANYMLNISFFFLIRFTGKMPLMNVILPTPISKCI